MSMLREVGVLLLVLSFPMVFSLSAPGRVLFEDVFEAEDIDKEPSLWDMVAGFTLRVVEDPDNPDNKVLAQQGEGNGLGIPVPSGWEDQDFWVDYIWEFDWMWDQDNYQGTAHRYQSAQGYYHSSRRLGGGNFIIYMWNGNFNELQNNPWSSETGVWYRMQSADIGNQHTVKGKPRDDDTPFEELGTIVSVEDDTYAEGPIGLFGTGGGTLYWDNIIVYEPGTDIHAVKPAAKLAVTWGRLKVK
jgi:hypothetical protein